MAAILNRDIANIKRYYNTTDRGKVDVAAIAEKLLPPISSMTQNKHPYHSVLLIPAVHGLTGVGNLKVIFEVRTDMTTLRGGQEPKRSWRLECVKDMTYVQRQPDISAQAKGLMQQLSIQASSVVPEPDFSIRVGTLRRHIEAVGIELNDALEIMIGEFEKAEAEAGLAAPAAPTATKPVAAKKAPPKRPGKNAAATPAAKNTNDDIL